MKSNTQKTNQPVRVELDYLSVVDECYFLNDELFTGLAYDHRDETLYKVYQIDEGEIIAEQDYGFFQLPPESIKLDVDVFEDLYEIVEGRYDPEPDFIYQGRPFNGVTYEYRGGFVCAEALWIDGKIVESITWKTDGSGLVYMYESCYGRDRCVLKWQSTQLQKVDIIKTSSIPRQNFSLAINENNEITSYALFGDANTFGPLVTRTDLPLEDNSMSELLTNYSIADEVFVNVDNDISFNFFMKYAALEAIKIIRVATKGLSPTALVELSEVPNLQSLCFHDQRVSQYQLDELDEQQRIQTRQQVDERNHALLASLFTIQAQRNCKIRLYGNVGISMSLLFSETGEGKLVATVDDDNNFSYLLSTLPLSCITKISLLQTALPLETLRKLTQFSQLKDLYVEEQDISINKLKNLDEALQEETLRQCNARNLAVWHLMEDLQTQLHCDIKFDSYSRMSFEKKYGS